MLPLLQYIKRSTSMSSRRNRKKRVLTQNDKTILYRDDPDQSEEQGVWPCGGVCAALPSWATMLQHSGTSGFFHCSDNPLFLLKNQQYIEVDLLIYCSIPVLVL